MFVREFIICRTFGMLHEAGVEVFVGDLVGTIVAGDFDGSFVGD